LLSNFALEYASRRVQVKKVGLRSNWIYKILAYANDVNLLGDNLDTINENTETLMDDSKEVGLEINVEKPKYIFISHHQNGGLNQDIKRANRPFENL
jgi:hypothetical protein